MKQQYALVPTSRFEDAVNVREELGDVADLAKSVGQYGVIEPVVGCYTVDGEGVELLMGQRRLAAARLAGLDKVPCLIRSRPDARERLMLQLAENMDRREMSPLEEGRAFLRLSNDGVSQTEIGKAVRRAQNYVSDRLILLRLPECVQHAVHRRHVTLNRALAIPRRLFDDPDALDRLERLPAWDDDRLGAWAEKEAGRLYEQTGENVRGARQLFHVINVRREVYDRAQEAARRDGDRVGVWVERLILQATGGLLEAVEDHG